jgi:hypothetical protein
MLFGENTWVDYVVAFEFCVDSGPGLYFMVHCGESACSATLDVAKWKLETGKWYQAHAMVWGDLMSFYCHDKARRMYQGNFKASERSATGGFGFRMPSESKARIRNIRYRRLSLPGQPFVPLPEGWIRLITPYDAIITVGTENAEGSWTEFEACFRLRNATKGLELTIRRTPNLRGQFEGNYESAKLVLPEGAAATSDWRDVRILVGPKDAALLVAGEEKARSAFSHLGAETILRPIQIGLGADQAGGKFELCDLKALVKKRGGGF